MVERRDDTDWPCVMAQALVQRFEREDREADSFRGRARAAAERVAVMLRERFGAARVYLFGSVVWGRPSREPDIDLGVEGIPAREFFAAAAATAAMVDGPVDLVPLEDAPEELRQRIVTEGVLLR